jgi:SNF2 family DNA or RNA helicase
MTKRIADSAIGAKPSEWVIAGNVLHLRLPSGAKSIPLADLIYRVAVEDEEIPGFPKPVSVVAVGEIVFERFPLALEIRIEPDKFGPSPGLKAVVYAKGCDSFVALDDVLTREADHLMMGKHWFPIARGALEEARAIFQEASIKETGCLSLKQYLKLLQLSTKYPAIKDASGEAASAIGQRAPVESDVPVGFSGTLYPYQKDGWRWLQLVTSQEVGGILADEMGLGKTVQLAALLAGEKEAARHPSLVVATGTLLENWRRELAKFSPRLCVMLHRGSDRSGFPADLKSNDVVVTSYDTLIRDLSLFRQIQWNIVILDEAQAIKNSETKRASAAKRIPRRVGIAVTGTPVENRLSDLWSITDFALPGFLGELNAFEKSFSNDEHGASALGLLVSPILLRRRVADVASDLPERIYIPQALELTEAQAFEYEEIRRSAIAEYGQGATLVALTRLRMYCAHPRLLGNPDSDPSATSAKYARLTEILEEIHQNGEKVLIFTSFNDMSDLIVSDLTQRFGVPTDFIDGRTPIDERQNVIDRFSAISGSAVLVLNPRAAGTGLNITSANHVIHYNLEWNPAVEDQASARAHRRGQTLPVTVHRLFYVDTVEEIIDGRVSAKRLLSKRAVVGIDGSEDNLSDIAAALARSPVRKEARRAG